MDPSSALTVTGDLVLPTFPGENPLRHEAQDWLETAEARLAAKGLLTVANGGDPPSTRQIVDIPLHELPELPPSCRPTIVTTDDAWRLACGSPRRTTAER